MKRISVIVVAIVAAALAPTQVQAQVDPYAADPLGLIAFQEQVQSYSLGADVIEVIVCDVPDGDVAVDPAVAAAAIAEELQPYFAWLSDGAYSPSFVPGPTVVAAQPSGWPDTIVLQPECERLAAQASAGSANGALVIVDVDYSGGYATAGVICDQVTDCPRTFPTNGRIMVVGAATVVATAELPAARFSTIAHELGHALDFPHSFGGLTLFVDGSVYEYDNPNDIMSGGSLTTLQVGTIAINRYAAGWATSGVAFHRGGVAVHTLAPPGVAGTQMLVLPSDTPGSFTVLGARRAESYDSGLGAAGVEVYRIDQRPTACVTSAPACWGADRRTAPVPAANDPETLAHVFGVGEQFAIDGATVTVDSASAGGWTVTVSGATVSERFVDDDGSVHEPSIESIAAIGITRGCNPPIIDRYCPTSAVSRAEMAVFLVRALDDRTVPTTGLGAFADVPDGVWYTDAVARIQELGITTGYADGTYRPNDPVSRAEMAVFLDRAFDAIQRSSAEVVFTDVAPDAFYASATQALFDSAVSLGCSEDPVRYCPFEQVTRGQMASFLTRALDVVGG